MQVDLIQWCSFFNGDTGAFFSPHSDGFIHIDEYKIMLPDHIEYVDKVADCMIECQQLDLTLEEQAIMTAITIMNARKFLTSKKNND